MDCGETTERVSDSRICSRGGNILVISSVSPQPTSAGEIILHRHLSQAECWAVTVIEDRRRGSQLSLCTRIIKRLYRTRLHRWAGSLDVLTHGHRWNELLSLTEGKTRGSIVLTVAHGDGCWAAQRFARAHSLPLATIFHDWWPDLPTVHAPLQRILDRRFRQLYQASDLAFCVSEGLKSALGPHRNCRILYPLAASPRKMLSLRSGGLGIGEGHYRVRYSGNLYDYGDMLGRLLCCVKEHPHLLVQVRGANPSWSEEFRAEMRAKQLWLDFAPRAELDHWLGEADSYLIVMDFAPRVRRRMETSFPSKLTEFAQFGKPLIVWGPEYCSAVQWARCGDRAVCVTNEQPLSLVAALEKLGRSPEQQQYYSMKAREAAMGEFNPESVQCQFLQSLHGLVDSRRMSVNQ